tara:strand:- start:42 stop:596 length:555 start_codon:yes stop_codon:yes gene_type:complete
MSEIQVNTINEYTSGNGVSVDGLSIKDGQVTDFMFDIWRQTADRTGSATDYELTSNWERVDDATIGFIGTGMSESSGIFTFPSTGIYKITFSLEVKNDTTTDGVQAQIQATTDDSSYNTIIFREISIRSSGDTEEGYAITTFDCTNTSTHKLKFVAADFKSSTVMNGSSTNSETYVIFERLGAT